MFGKEENEEKENQKEQALPLVEQGQTVETTEIKLHEGKHNLLNYIQKGN